MNPLNSLCTLLALLGVAFSAELHAQSTAFSYQGQLSNGIAATGPFELRFALHDSAHISLVHADGAALAAIQGLHEKLEIRISKSEDRNAAV